MSSPMSTDLDAQSASSGRIGGLSERGQQVLSSMDGVANELKVLWKGEGSNAFQLGTADLQQQLQKSKVALQDVSEKVGHNNTGYSTADSTNASSLSSTGL